MSGRSLSEVGEFGLIRRLVERLPAGEGVLVGPGDDAAVLAVEDRRLLAAADLLVEGAHFDLSFSSPADVGFKALAANASDIAAMGGAPRYAMVSIGVPGSTDPKSVEALYDGLRAAAEEFGCAIVGGDTVSSPQWIVSVAIVGEPSEAGPVRRDGARPGDVLCVTGELGAAAAGLALLRARRNDPTAHDLLSRYPGLADAHRRGRARVREGRAAAAHATAMIDVSDGLAQDVGHIANASRLAVVIDGRALPVAEGVAEVEEWLAGPQRPTGDVRVLAVRGGDDYELAMAVPPGDVDLVAAAIAPTALTPVGTFERGTGVDVAGLAEAEFAALGWDHFAR